MVVGASPELCVVVLLTPTLKDDEVLTVQGAQALISMTGYGRDAHLYKNLELDPPSAGHFSKWRRRTVFFMDALELDAHDTSQLTPDLLPGNVDRELQKAYTAFSSLRNCTQGFEVVVTGLWGCRSFGGNRQIKTIIRWLAASLAGTKLLFVCAGKDHETFSVELRSFIKHCLNNRCITQDLLAALRGLSPTDQSASNAFESVMAVCREETDTQGQLMP